MYVLLSQLGTTSTGRSVCIKPGLVAVAGGPGQTAVQLEEDLQKNILLVLTDKSSILNHQITGKCRWDITALGVR